VSDTGALLLSAVRCDDLCPRCAGDELRQITQGADRSALPRLSDEPAGSTDFGSHRAGWKRIRFQRLRRSVAEELGLGSVPVAIIGRYF